MSCDSLPCCRECYAPIRVGVGLCAECCEDCTRRLRVRGALLTEHRVVIQRLLCALDRLRGVAECAPQERRETYDFEALDDLVVEANRVIMMSGEDVKIG